MKMKRIYGQIGARTKNPQNRPSGTLFWGFLVVFFVASLFFSAPRQSSLPTQARFRKTSKIHLAKKKFYIQPLGHRLSKKTVKEIQVALKEFYGFQVIMLPKKALPKFAYYRPRRRYRAEKLLDYLRRLAPSDAFRMLGVTAVDISTTKGKYKDWGIMGLATLSGKCAVISMYRCRKGSRNKTHARHRMAKVAVHEIGHTLGLKHCPTRGCLMEDAKGTNKTTDREHLLCPKCYVKLAQEGYLVPKNPPKPPWPKPKRWKGFPKTSLSSGP